MTNLPAYLQNQTGPRLAERTIANLGAGSPPYVSIKGNRFTLIDSTGAEEAVTTIDQKTGMMYLDCVVVDALERESKIYYGKAFDPSAQSFSPPDCWSDNGIAPSRNAGSPQSPTCASCPKAEWGSAVSKVSGKGVPACGKYQKLALMLPGDEVTFLLRVPPNSLGHLRDYLAKFNGQNFDVKDVTTRMSFIKDTLGTLTFYATGFIDEAAYKQREALLTTKATDLLVGRGDLPREGLLPSPTPAAQIAAPLAAHTRETPYAAPQGRPLGLPTQQTTPTAASQGSATTASPSEAPKRGRPKRQAAQQEAPQAAPATAPFAQSAPPNGSAPFGIAESVPANPELQQTINSIFGPA